MSRKKKTNVKKQQQKSIKVEHDFLLWSDLLKTMGPFILLILCASPTWLFYENSKPETCDLFDAILYATLLCGFFFTFRFISHFIILDISSIIFDIPHIHCTNNLTMTVWMVVAGENIVNTMNSQINMKDVWFDLIFNDSFNTTQIDPLSAHDAFGTIGHILIMSLVTDLFCLFFALYQNQRNIHHINNTDKLNNIMSCLWTHCESHQFQTVLYLILYLIFLYYYVPQYFDKSIKFILPASSIVFGLSFKSYLRIIGIGMVATIIDNIKTFGEVKNWYRLNEQDVVWLNWQSSNGNTRK